MPKPSSMATVLVVQTPRIRIIRMSTRGWVLRDSLRTHSTRKTAPATNRPTVLTDSQCHTAVWLTATSTAPRPTDINAAPVQLTRPATRMGDSGTRKWMATVAATSGINGTQNRSWTDPWSTIGPASTTPAPPPTPASAAMMPTAPATRSRGNSSRMIPNDSGNTPPAAPWKIRPMSITVSDVASAETTVARQSTTSTITSSRSLPYMSPSRPISGVAIDALSRYAVSTQLTELTEVCSSRWKSGIAGATSDCSSA